MEGSWGSFEYTLSDTLYLQCTRYYTIVPGKCPWALEILKFLVVGAYTLILSLQRGLGKSNLHVTCVQIYALLAQMWGGDCKGSTVVTMLQGIVPRYKRWLLLNIVRVATEVTLAHHVEKAGDNTSDPRMWPSVAKAVNKIIYFSQPKTQWEITVYSRCARFERLLSTVMHSSYLPAPASDLWASIEAATRSWVRAFASQQLCPRFSEKNKKQTKKVRSIKIWQNALFASTSMEDAIHFDIADSAIMRCWNAHDVLYFLPTSFPQP